MTDWRTIDFRPAMTGWRIWRVSTADDGSAWSIPMPGWLIQEEATWDEIDGYRFAGTEPANRMRRVIAAEYEPGGSEPYAVEDCWMILGPGAPDPGPVERAKAIAEQQRLEQERRERVAAQHAEEEQKIRAALTTSNA